MNIKRLGIDWGAAFEEAQPVRITHGDAEPIEVFVNENHELVIEFRGGFKVDFIQGKMRISLSQ